MSKNPLVLTECRTLALGLNTIIIIISQKAVPNSSYQSLLPRQLLPHQHKHICLQTIHSYENHPSQTPRDRTNKIDSVQMPPSSALVLYATENYRFHGQIPFKRPICDPASIIKSNRTATPKLDASRQLRRK